jgi:hypothetical protein
MISLLDSRSKVLTDPTFPPQENGTGRNSCCVEGARGYNMCQVLHSHNDEVAIRILKAQLRAMSADPVPLIDDKAISDEKGSDAPSVLSATEFSLTMFEMFKGVERREAEWRKLFDDAGCRVDAL